MATMYSLFLSLLCVAVLFFGGIGNLAVERRFAGDQPRSIALGIKARHQDRIGNLRERIVAVAAQEIGVQEATGRNDGSKVEEYLAYTGLGKGHAWCAAFASWCYGQAGLSAPRNAWSPALFPIARRYTGQQIREESIQPADLFGIYNQDLRRIDHVGMIQKVQGHWILTVEGNVANRVVSKRRPVLTIYAFSNWLD